MLRLLAPFGGSRRVVLGDSAFASVQTAVQLVKQLGLFFIGVVKSCTRMYPLEYTQQHDFQHRGDHVALTAKCEGVDVRAVGWGDKKVKSFVATCDTTVAGEPHQKKQWKNHNNGTTEYFTKGVPRPRMACDYYDGCQIIDAHNAARQGRGLGLEMRPTTRWQLRFFQTFVGFVEVDALHCYTYFAAGDDGPKQSEFVRTVAKALVNNTRGGAHQPLRPPRGGGRPAAAASSSPQPHELLSLARTEYGRERQRQAELTGLHKPCTLRCRECATRTTFCCLTCSDLSEPFRPRKLHAICSTSSRHRRTCFRDHQWDDDDDGGDAAAAASGGRGGGGTPAAAAGDGRGGASTPAPAAAAGGGRGRGRRGGGVTPEPAAAAGGTGAAVDSAGGGGRSARCARARKRRGGPGGTRGGSALGGAARRGRGSDAAAASAAAAALPMCAKCNEEYNGQHTCDKCAAQVHAFCGPRVAGTYHHRCPDCVEEYGQP